jgi:hypothetical protein
MLNSLRKRIGPRTILKKTEETVIRAFQNSILEQNYDPKAENLIIFLSPGEDVSVGGILSITAIYEETKKLKSLHHSEVIMCTTPGDPLLIRYTKFKNQNYILRFSKVLAYFKNLKRVIIHIPELAVKQFQEKITPQDRHRLAKIEKLQINILIQNIELLSPIKYIKELKKIGKVTCTTNHEKYSTSEMRQKLDIPLHFLSWFLSQEQYINRKYADKKDLMIISPDPHPMRKEIIKHLETQLTNTTMQVIQNLTYEEYKELISWAKWGLTFGEGIDGYFVETAFSGGISFAIHKPAFFTEDFRALRTVYADGKTMKTNIVKDIKAFDNPKAFTAYNQEEFELCAKYFNHEQYAKSIKAFYEEKYTIP